MYPDTPPPPSFFVVVLFFIFSFMRNAKGKSHGKACTHIVSEAEIVQTIRSWCVR
jgi:hypothetical protein